ncbi:hypothetical protein [Idiomarina fontislapidosi]|nr:hypothetical protein [Idiomarina fontislapidosi]
MRQSIAVGGLALGHLFVDLAKSWLRRREEQDINAAWVLILEK